VNTGMSDNRIDSQDKDMVNQVRRTLDHSCDRLDAQTRSRLNSIRHAALEQAGRKKTWPMLAPFGGLVTACVLVLVVSMNYNGSTVQPVNKSTGSGMAIEDLDILTSTESLEFYENLEFYQWLEENETSV